MPKLWIRYRNGDEDTWLLHERTDYEELHKVLMDALRGGGGEVEVGVQGRSNEEVNEVEYTWVGNRIDDVSAYAMEGLIDEERTLSWLGASLK
jgi:hypothetical protein